MKTGFQLNNNKKSQTKTPNNYTQCNACICGIFITSSVPPRSRNSNSQHSSQEPLLYQFCNIIYIFLFFFSLFCVSFFYFMFLYHFFFAHAINVRHYRNCSTIQLEFLCWGIEDNNKQQQQQKKNKNEIDFNSMRII